MLRTCLECHTSNRVPARHLASMGRCGKCHSPIPPVDAPLAVQESEFDEIIGQTAVPVLVDFWAAWCGPCKMAAPEFAAAAKSLTGKAILLKVDTEQNQHLAARYAVRSIPSFLLFNRGQKVTQQSGVLRSDDIVKMVSALQA